MKQPNQHDTLVLVDGSSYLYRAFYALPSLSNSIGEPTGAIFGIINMLHKLMQEFQPKYMAVVFDAKGDTFRKDIYAEYKAHRPPMPPELRSQVEPIHRIIHALGLPLLMVERVEADDVIATLAENHKKDKLDIWVATGDKDLAQIVDEHVKLIDTMKDRRMDREGVRERFGVTPEQMIDLLALMGDKSDNVPGIPGVGEKTAAKWLQTYETIDGVLENRDKLGAKGKKLSDCEQQIPMSRELVTVKRDLQLGIQLSDLMPGDRNTVELRQLYQRYQFNTLLKALGPAPASDKKDYLTVDDEDKLQRVLDAVAGAELVAFDTETTSLDYMQARLVGMSFRGDNLPPCYIPLAHRGLDMPIQLDKATVLSRFKPLFENPAIKKIGHHIKYDMHVLAHDDIHLQGIAHDTMLESYVLNSTANRHDMDSLALKFLGVHTISYEEVAGKGAHQINFSEVAVDKATEYAAEDAEITWQLHQTLYPTLPETSRKVYEEMELPLIPVLLHMERNGVLIDTALLKKQSEILNERILELEAQAEQMAGQPFNLSSPKQIQQILYEKQNLPVLRKTPKGQPSTAEDVLQELAWDYPLPKLILEHRGLIKLKSTYVDKLPEQVNPDTGRVHTSYHQAVAATGRLSSSDPNLQNIPIRSEEGRQVRKAFIPEPGCVMVSADYSQIELRIMAHLSRDPALCRAFADGDDIHRATAAEIFAIDTGQVNKEQRRSAKAINFGLIYGMSAFGLGKQLGIERQKAQQYIDRYFERYPAVKVYMDNTRQLARDQEYVETLFGRRLYVPEIKSRNFQRRQYAERTAINAPMQGTAADIIKRAMIRVHRWITEENPDVRMIMQVHDELVFEIPRDRAGALMPVIQTHMSEAASLDVPLIVDINHGGNWEEAH